MSTKQSATPSPQAPRSQSAGRGERKRGIIMTALKDLPENSQISITLESLLQLTGSNIPESATQEQLARKLNGITQGIPECGLVWFPDLEATIILPGYCEVTLP